MSEALDTDIILAKVRAILVEVLMVEPSEVVPTARVITDLDAESIDLLDLRFRVERTFGIRVTEQDLVEEYGNLSEAAAVDAFTVGALCEYVRKRMEARND